jgi:hypothetical protein
VIYVQKETEAPLVECGDRLGDMTNELKPGEYIEEFVSGGPKNYACRLLSGKTVCKVRGIILIIRHPIFLISISFEIWFWRVRSGRNAK